MFPKIVKTGLIGISLARSIEKSYGFASLGIVPEVFGPESATQDVVRLQLRSN